MKLRCHHGVVLLCCLAFAGFSQPANDTFTNRIVLVGDNISFSGTLAQATRESDPFEITPTFLDFSVSQTVWWQWTPTQSTSVTIEILDSDKPVQGTDGVAVSELENLSTGREIAGLRISLRLPNRFFTFSAIAETNYYIQLVGLSGASFDLRLRATDLPQIIAPPESQSLTVGDSVVFYVVAASQLPLTYQWQHDGTNLVGETLPILAIANVNLNQIGSYSVWITNTAGETASQFATLNVTPTDTSPTLSIAQQTTNAFDFFLVGDVGRRYRIQSSTNLIHWLPEASFGSTTFYDPYQSQPPLRSVVSDSSGTNRLTLARTGAVKFFRTIPFHAANEVCNNNIKRLRLAQLLFAYETGADEIVVVSELDLLPYVGQFPTCPLGGYYWLSLVCANPVCPIHSFEER